MGNMVWNITFLAKRKTPMYPQMATANSYSQPTIIKIHISKHGKPWLTTIRQLLMLTINHSNHTVLQV